MLSLAEELEQELIDDGVCLLESKDIPSRDPSADGLYSAEEGIETIAIRSELYGFTRLAAVAHEWGHHHGGAPWPGANATVISRYEERAFRCQARRLIPIDVLRTAMQSGKALSDIFGLSDEMINHASRCTG